MKLGFDLIGTLAVASVLLWCGNYLRSRVRFLKEFNIPAPVIGGVLFALLQWALIRQVEMVFDMTLKDPLMIAFFTTVGLGASLKLLKQGGPQVFIFLGLASCLVVLQDVVAVGIAKVMGLHPLLGLLAGSVTMSGGHGTGATFAQTFTRDFGLMGAMELAMAAATFGLIMGSVIGGPLARRLIQKRDLKPGAAGELPDGNRQVDPVQGEGQATTVQDVLSTLLQILLAMFLGARAYSWLIEREIMLPTYICALFIGILIRNAADLTQRFRVNLKCIDYIGSVSLSLFLAMALMSLKLWQLKGLAGPMAVILLGQTLLMVLFASLVTFRFMGKDFDAAIMAGGHCGFGMGAVPNAVANMEALCSNYGPAPRAFFVVPIVGAFFIDIVNAFVIQAFVAFLG